MTTTPDGKVLIALQTSETRRICRQSVGPIARLTGEGFLDASFATPKTDEEFNLLYACTDGSVLAANPTTLKRFASTGLPDVTFAPAVNFTAINAIRQLSDGKVLVAGKTMVGGMQMELVRLNPDGSLDPAFQPSHVDGDIMALAELSDGKLLVGGSFSLLAGSSVRDLARLHPSGSLDATFQTGAVFDFWAAKVHDLEVLPDGKIAVAGDDFGPDRTSLARLLPTGAPDMYFAGLIYPLRAISVDSSGRILAAVERNLTYGIHHVERFLSDGSKDATYNPVTGDVLGLETRDASVVAFGYTALYGIDGFGNRTSFFNETGPDAEVTDIFPRENGSIVLHGTFTRYDNIPAARVIGINSDGSLAQTFPNLPAPQLVQGQAFTRAFLQSDGKLLYSNGPNLTRWKPDGTIDATFATYNSPDQINSLAVQPDGKILVGVSTVYNRSALKRLLPNGEVDSTFAPDPVLNYGVAKIIRVRSDGKLLIAGGSFRIGGADYKLIQLNESGSLDTGFQLVWSSFQPVRDIQLLPNGKILVAGQVDHSSAYIPESRQIARLHANGSVDPSFNSGILTTGVIERFVVQATGKVVVAGRFSDMHGVPRSSIARLDEDGSFDSTFNGGTDPFEYNAPVALAVDAAGDILFGGGFGNLKGSGRHNLARLRSSGPSSAPIHLSPWAWILDEDASLDLQVSAGISSSGPLTWTRTLPGIGNCALVGSSAAATATYTPDPNKNGADRFAIISTDAAGNADSTVFQLEVKPVNDPPVPMGIPTFPKAIIATFNAVVYSAQWNDSIDTPAGAFIERKFQWQVADDPLGHNAAMIPGATGSQIVFGMEYAGLYVRAVETATDTGVGLPTQQSTTVFSPWERVYVPITFASWKTIHFGSASDPAVIGPTADPDRDGISNIEEYGSGFDPNAPEPGLPAQAKVELRIVDGGTHRLFARYRHDPGAIDVQPKFQSSLNLINWNDDVDWMDQRFANPDGSETIEHWLDLPPSRWGGPNFIRVKLTAP